MNNTEKMVLELHAAGKSIPDIAARIGRTESTVYMYLSRHGLNPSKCRKRPELGIGSWRIKQARNKARVGSRIRVKSVKTVVLGDENAKLISVSVLARVISTASKYFCLVAHGSASCGLIWSARAWTDTEGEEYGRGREKHCCGSTAG